MSDYPRVGTRVRRIGNDAGVGPGHVAAPADRHRPAPLYPQRAGDRVDQDDDRDAGKPRSTPRPMPEYPREGYGGYRLFGRPPAAAGWWVRLVDWLLGKAGEYLYMGITVRAGFVRWVEHSDVKVWARDVTDAETIEGEWWATLNNTVIDQRTGKPWLVWDAAATADDGIRPVRPGELVHTEPTPAVKHGEPVDVFTLDPYAGVLLEGRIVEGARTGEKRIIQGWEGGPRPRHNIEHNDGEHAVNRVKRRVPRLITIARRRALGLAVAWLVLAALAGWWCAGAMPLHTAALVGAGAAATLLQTVQLGRLALAGAPLKPRRRAPRKPRGSRARQKAKRAFLRRRRRR